MEAQIFGKYMSKKKLPNLKHFLSGWLPVIAWAGLIFYLSNQSILPGFKVSVWDYLFKKTAHITVYAILYVLIQRALNLTTKLNINVSWKVALLLCVLYGVSDEIHQSFVSGRQGTLRDVGFDTLGSSLVILRKLRYI